MFNQLLSARACARSPLCLPAAVHCTSEIFHVRFRGDGEKENGPRAFCEATSVFPQDKFVYLIGIANSKVTGWFFSFFFCSTGRRRNLSRGWRLLAVVALSVGPICVQGDGISPWLFRELAENFMMSNENFSGGTRGLEL